MPASRAIATLALLAGAGCFQANSDGGGVGVNQTSCDTCKHNSNVGGGAGGGSSSASGSSGGSSGSGSSTGGASSGGVASTGAGGGSSGSSGGSPPDAGAISCSSILAYGTPITCPSGSLDLSSQLVDYLECTAVAGGTVNGLNPAGIPYTSASGLSAANGTFSLCLPEDSPFSLQTSAPQYPTTYFAELQDVQPQELSQIGMLSTSFIDALPALVPGGLDFTKGLVLVKVNTSITCDTLRAGWSVEMTISDGGSFPDGSYELVYLASTGVPTTGLDATTNSGGAIFYNIDPTLTSFVDISFQNPDAGPDCQPENDAYGFTGRVYIAGNAVSVSPILLP